MKRRMDDAPEAMRKTALETIDRRHTKKEEETMSPEAETAYEEFSAKAFAYANVEIMRRSIFEAGYQAGLSSKEKVATEHVTLLTRIEALERSDRKHGYDPRDIRAKTMASYYNQALDTVEDALAHVTEFRYGNYRARTTDGQSWIVFNDVLENQEGFGLTRDGAIILARQLSEFDPPCNCDQSVPFRRGDHHTRLCPMYADKDGLGA